MRSYLKDSAFKIILTLVLFNLLMVLSTALLPTLGLSHFSIPFNVALVIFLGFKLENEYMAVWIFFVHYFYSFFSIESWEFGTIIGIFVYWIIIYVKEMIHFSSKAMTIAITQLFQVVWFILLSILIYLKGGDAASFTARLWRFLPESFLLSLMAPFLFSVLDRIWQTDRVSSFGDSQ